MRLPAFMLLAAAFPARAMAAEPGMDNEMKNLTWVGFQQLKDASRVYVKTTEPVKYTVNNERADLIVLLLDNTRVPLVNNTRPLDTQYFDSPVQLIEVKPVEGPSASVRIEIHLRSKATFKPVQKDTMLALDFVKA